MDTSPCDLNQQRFHEYLRSNLYKCVPSGGIEEKDKREEKGERGRERDKRWNRREKEGEKERERREGERERDETEEEEVKGEEKGNRPCQLFLF